MQAAGHPEAWRWLERAGQRAHRAYAWITAAERFGAAAELLREIEGEEAHYAQLIFRMTLLRRLSDASRTIAGLEEVEALAERLGDPVGAAEAQFHRGIHLCYADRFAEGLRAMENSLERLEALPLDAARAHQAIEFWFAGIASSSPAIDLSRNEVVAARLNAAGFDFRRCVHLWKSGMAGDSLANVLETSERFNALLADEPVTAGGVRFAAAWTHLATAIALAALGRSDEARPHWTGSHALFNAVNHFALIAFALLTELRDVALTYGAANPDHRRRLAADAETALARAGGALRPGISPRLGWLGCWLLDGRWAAADEALRDAPPPGNAYLRREVTVTTALLARHRDEPDTAWAQIGLALPHGPATAPGDGIHQEGLLLQRLAAELCLDAGDLATARSWLESHDRWLAWSGSMLGRADGELGWAGWLRAAGDHARARARAVAALELAAAPAQPLTQLAGRRLLGELAAGAGDMPDGERHFAAALDLADACEAPFERALTLVSLAEARQAAGASGVEALIDEARAIATPLRANRLLSRLDAIGSERTARAAVASSPEGLTRREIEVLRLLAEHRTDKEIAEALFISPHTASTHVKHLLAKLGVASRREAPARAARLIPPEPTT